MVTAFPSATSLFTSASGRPRGSASFALIWRYWSSFARFAGEEMKRAMNGRPSLDLPSSTSFTRFEAFAVIYALALGAADRGIIYMAQYPGVGGKLLFLACCSAVMMGGGKILDAVKLQAQQPLTPATA